MSKVKELRRKTTHRIEREKLKKGVLKRVHFMLTEITFNKLKKFREVHNLKNKEVIFLFLELYYLGFEMGGRIGVRQTKCIEYLVKQDEFEKIQVVKNLKKELKITYEDMIIFVMNHYVGE